MEIEYKLSADTGIDLKELLNDTRLQSLASSNEEERLHSSVYFDTPDGVLDQSGITLRLRTEDSGDRHELVCCLKQKPEIVSHNYKVREEYDYIVPEDRISDGMYKKFPSFCIDGLKEAGVPDNTINKISGLELYPSAKVTYTRIAKLMRISSDTLCELALDEGVFASGERFKEVELELIRGSVEELQVLVSYLMRKYKMRIQPLSKRARAKL